MLMLLTMSRMMLLIASVMLGMTPPVIDGQLSFSAYDRVIQNGGNITVQWRNQGRTQTVGSSDKDEVRLYCPPVNNSLYDDAFIDRWSILEASTSRNAAGTTGNISVGPIINMRDECQLIFFRWRPQFGFHLPFTTVVGQNVLVTFPDGGAQPLQGHIAMTGSPGELRITWVSSNASSADPSVWYRKENEPDSTALRISALPGTTYAAGDLCGGAAATVNPNKFRDPGLIYSAVMTGLTPNTAYTYWYGSDDNGKLTLSPEQNITTPQATTNTGQQTTCRIIAFADMGVWGGKNVSSLPTNSKSKSVVDLIQNRWLNDSGTIDMIAHVGGLSHATGKGYVWERFFYRIEPVATRVPYHVGVGNYEYGYVGQPTANDPSGVKVSYKPSWANYGNDSNGECGVPTAERFHMPQSPGSNGVFWYSVDVANVHFVMISTEHDLSPGSVQYNWLKSDLGAINRATQPWVVVAGHRPLYNNEKRQQDDDLPVQRKLREFLNPVFAEFSVNLYVCGHYHNYVRTAPISSNGSVVSTGTVHITAGTGGADLGTGEYHPVPWAVKNLTTFGVISIETSGPQTMAVEFVSTTGSVLDSVTIKQNQMVMSVYQATQDRINTNTNQPSNVTNNMNTMNNTKHLNTSPAGGVLYASSVCTVINVLSLVYVFMG
ncbi:uncharacterized protein LOC135810798 [Sycon ciliatum]|uniref:uncharacterized protein LOC135810798 n=1 Tax=Sycon ciliatum TaxID=27933 RepID=UPI0031F6D0AC